MRKTWLTALALATGTSVAAAQRPSVVPLNATFHDAGDSAVVSELPKAAFWETLGDSTLTRLMREALDANRDVHAAEARVRQARASRSLATFDFAPTITAVGGYTRQRLSGATFPGFTAFPDQNLWDAGVDASWELDIFGRVRGNVKAQGAFLASAREDVRDVQVTLAGELARTYFDLRGAQGQLAVARRNAENQRKTLELTQQRLDAGRGTAFDTERARAQLSTTLASIPSFESRVAASAYRLGVLVGRAPAALADELKTPADLPALPATVAVGVPDSLVRNRPDVRSAERQLAAREALVGSAKAGYFPTLSLAGTAGFTATSFDSIGKSGTSRFAVGPVLSWPLLNLGRVKARVDATRADREEARARYEQSVLSALAEAESAITAYGKARERLTLLDDAARASASAAELARLRFDGGVADFLQVLDAERTLLEAQDRLAQGRTDATTAFVQVYKALGGTWPVAVDASR